MSHSVKVNVRGLLGRKIGMTQVWDADNHIVPVTVIAADTNVVTQIRSREVDGYSAVQLGFGEIEGRKVNKPETGHFEKAGVTPRRHVVEIRTEAISDYTPVSYTHLRAHETGRNLVCRLLLEKK